MFNRKKIKELEAKVAYYHDMYIDYLQFILTSKRTEDRILDLLDKKLVPTLDAKELAVYLSKFPLVKSCGPKACTWSVRIPVEELNKYLDEPIKIPSPVKREFGKGAFILPQTYPPAVPGVPTMEPLYFKGGVGGVLNDGRSQETPIEYTIAENVPDNFPGLYLEPFYLKFKDDQTYLIPGNRLSLEKHPEIQIVIQGPEGEKDTYKVQYITKDKSTFIPRTYLQKDAKFILQNPSL